MKMNLLIAVLFISMSCWSQSLTFQRLFHDYSGGINTVPRSVIQTSDGGFAMTQSGHNVAFAKFDAGGLLQWRREYYIGEVHSVDGIQQDTSGGYFLTGIFWDPSIGRLYYAMKVDSAGDAIWCRRYRVMGSELSTPGGFYGGMYYGWSGVCSTLDTAQNLVFAGVVYENIPTSYRLHVTKLDSSGFIQWTKYFDSIPWGKHIYDLEYRPGTSASVPDMFYVLTNSKYTDRLRITAIRGDGALVWSRSYSGVNLAGAYSIEYTSDHHLILCGQCPSPLNPTWETDIFMMKTDSTGNLIWANAYDGPATEEWGNCVAECVDGNYIVAGGVSAWPVTSATWMKFDGNGIPIWRWSYGIQGHNLASILTALPLSDTSIVFTGIADTSFMYAGFFFKTNTQGNLACGPTALISAVFPMALVDTSYLHESIAIVETASLTPVEMAQHFYDQLFCNGQVSIEENQQEQFLQWYPNPSSGIFHLQSSSLVKEIHAFDLQGNLVYTSMPNDRQLTIDLSAYPAGIYLIRTTGGNGVSDWSRVVKSH